MHYFVQFENQKWTIYKKMENFKNWALEDFKILLIFFH